MCGSLRMWKKPLPSHVLSDPAMLLCLIHNLNTYSPSLLQPWRWVAGRYPPAGLCGVTAQKPQYKHFCSPGLESCGSWCRTAGSASVRTATSYITKECSSQQHCENLKSHFWSHSQFQTLLSVNLQNKLNMIWTAAILANVTFFVLHHNCYHITKQTRRQTILLLIFCYNILLIPASQKFCHQWQKLGEQL